MNKSNPPVFILCPARTGSTLLRSLLNAHPKLYCPQELHLFQFIKPLSDLFNKLVAPAENQHENLHRNSILISKVSDQLNSIMDTACAEAGKEIWCEKSIYTLDSIEVVKKVFPNAKYICLYRNSLDQVASGLECLRVTPDGSGFGFQNFLRQAHPDRIGGLLDYWLDKTQKIMAFEKNNLNRAYRVRYEDLVQDPEQTITGLLDFLEVEHSPEMLTKAFEGKREDQAGDYKFRSTNKVHTDSLGKQKIPPEQIKGGRSRKINRFHKKLGYEEISA